MKGPCNGASGLSCGASGACIGAKSPVVGQGCLSLSKGCLLLGEGSQYWSMGALIGIGGPVTMRWVPVVGGHTFLEVIPTDSPPMLVTYLIRLFSFNKYKLSQLTKC